MTDDVDKLTESISQLTIDNKTIIDVLKELSKNPDLLKKKESRLTHILQFQGDPESQGTGNKVTSQEACFAEVLESFGYKFISNDSPFLEENCYKYQVSGTQAKLDFVVFDKTLNKIINFDVKHTKDKTVFLNDGWLDDGTIYVFNWTFKKQNRIVIGYGNEMRTEEEHEKMKELIEIKKDLNTRMEKKCGSLRIYFRFANRYVCDKFTDEFTLELFNSVLTSLSP